MPYSVNGSFDNGEGVLNSWEILVKKWILFGRALPAVCCFVSPGALLPADFLIQARKGMVGIPFHLEENEKDSCKKHARIRIKRCFATRLSPAANSRAYGSFFLSSRLTCKSTFSKRLSISCCLSVLNERVWI